ncbi:MAG: SpoIIE family protein phosphatase [Candidatus Aminicenantes bacterium]|nr:SpoIIE family protein phosphatase [Candidatus Aminicenantes bacterium]NIM84036.1 SpoIIE family protein phosphatase [Candidatus Aminicenantes bacterium]NIN23500.1 SpoIIE family protein phosphatase [Candidatus Aminicenantes bacterium]NIN47205.1 SpoIIE family protein phosphatase [Candidatus Aminicenantes bacterium]NIN90131.1 SpoIIE family protein phosphatase [Candidatus Aminicenantes bacterium]
MNKKTLNKFRHILVEHRDTLDTWLKSNSESKEVHLGGAPVQEVEKVVSQHTEALERINRGEFGQCTECSGDIEPERLELDFTTCVCLDHYSESQLRLLERDLELAAKVQRQLLPHAVPVLPGVQIAAHTEPAQVVGGDYFDFFSYPDGSQGVVIADVMGKGLSASMLMSNLQASLRILGPEHPELYSLANRLNELFLHNVKLISFISMFLVRIDENAGIVHYCNAGHNPAIRWEAASGTIHWLKPTGPAIGLTRKPSFKLKELPFSSGDILLLYTDGLVEAQNPGDDEDNEFGKERLATYVKEHFHQSADVFLAGLRETVKDFAGGFHDDVTLVVIKSI